VNAKKILFTSGIILQVGILGITLQTLHDTSQRKELFAVESYSQGEEDLFNKEERGVNIPFRHFVTAVGKVAPSSDYVHVNTVEAGIIESVFVKQGQMVKEGDLLFQMNDSAQFLSLREKVAEYETALARFQLLQEEPSNFELKAKEQEIEKAKLKYVQSEKDNIIFESLFEKCAVSKHEKETQEIQLKTAAFEIKKLLCEYDQIKEGASEAFIKVGKAELGEKEAALRSVEKKLANCKVTAPIQGRVLSVNVHPGEYIEPTEKSAIVIGLDNPLHLRVYVDEKDAWRISPSVNLRAIAVHKSNPKIQFILNFVATNPCLQKQSGQSEKLEVVFSFDKGKAPIYLEENLEVFIEAASPNDTGYLDYQFNLAR
jgi:HlyD family secretion protein